MEQMTVMASVGMADPRPSPLQRVEDDSNEPADVEIVGDDKLLARYVAD
ncbi:hypothetical protein [Streptomyces lavendulocolor]